MSCPGADHRTNDVSRLGVGSLGGGKLANISIFQSLSDPAICFAGVPTTHKHTLLNSPSAGTVARAIGRRTLGGLAGGERSLALWVTMTLAESPSHLSGARGQMRRAAQTHSVSVGRPRDSGPQPPPTRPSLLSGTRPRFSSIRYLDGGVFLSLPAFIHPPFFQCISDISAVYFGSACSRLISCRHQRHQSLSLTARSAPHPAPPPTPSPFYRHEF